MKVMDSAERIAILLAAATIGCCCARAPDAGKVVDPNAYPPGVQQVLQSARDACKSEGGGKVTFAPDTVRALHLTGYDRDDYIVDFHNARCQDRDGVYCGSGGCELDIVVTLAGGGTRLVFSQRVRGYKLLPLNGTMMISFELHGGYCGGHGVPSCFKMRHITTQPFKFTMPR